MAPPTRTTLDLHARTVPAIPEPEAPDGGVFFPRRLAARAGRAPERDEGRSVGAAARAAPREPVGGRLEPVEKVVTHRTPSAVSGLG